MQPTVAAIAARTGLSKATVSLAIHGHPRISGPTRERVVAIARELGYNPQVLVSACMAAVRAGHSATGVNKLLFVVPDAGAGSRQGVMLAYAGARQRAQERGWTLERAILREPTDCARLLDRQIRREYVGVVIAPCGENPPELELPWNQVASVMLEGMPPARPLHRVSYHSHVDTREAVRRLAALGYRRPGFVTTSFDLARTNGTALAAFCAMRAELGGLGMVAPLVAATMAETGAIADWMLQQRPDVVVGENWAAVSAAARRCRLRIPDDLGYIGIGATSPPAECSCYLRPHRTMGATALDVVAAQLIRRQNDFFTAPRLVVLPGQWHPGRTLPARADS